MLITVTTKTTLKDLIDARSDAAEIRKVLEDDRIKGEGGNNYGISFEVTSGAVYFDNILPSVPGYDMPTESLLYNTDKPMAGMSFKNLNDLYFQASGASADIKLILN